MTKPQSTKPRVKQVPAAPNGTKGNLGNHYLSTCKLCPAGVFDHEPHVWLRKPMGWSHTYCAKQAGHVE